MLRLRPFRKNDAKYIIDWTNEPEEFYKWSAGILGEFPLTEQRMIPRYVNKCLTFANTLR